MPAKTPTKTPAAKPHGFIVGSDQFGRLKAIPVSAAVYDSPHDTAEEAGLEDWTTADAARAVKVARSILSAMGA